MSDDHWTEGSLHWYYLDNGKGEVIASISGYDFPFRCFIGGAAVGDYTTLDIAKEKLLEKCRKKKLIE